MLTGDPIRDALAATRQAKREHPEILTVWGGWHPSLFPTETLEEASIDVTVQGQGEETFERLVEHTVQDLPLDGLRGICRRRGDELDRHPPRPLVPMDTLRRYDFGLIPVDSYFERKGRRQLDYISSTGCPFRCTFCADPFVFGRRFAAFSPERVGAELEALWRRYRFTEVAFQDETFFTYRDRVLAIADEILRRDLHFDWTATLRADQAVRLTEEGLRLCASSGLRRVMVGVESGSQEMLDWMKKDITVGQVVETAQMCSRNGVGGIFPFIVGFPGESEVSVRQTLELIKRLRAMSPAFETPLFYFKPYPGSAITDEVVRQGHRLPRSLEEWAEFDFIGSAGPWVSAEKYRFIERFKFYNRFAWGPENWRRRPLQRIARWRCRRDFYALPFERTLVERLRPQPRLS